MSRTGSGSARRPPLLGIASIGWRMGRGAGGGDAAHDPPGAGWSQTPARREAPVVLWIALLPLIVLVQVALIAFLPVPWAVPDLVVVTVLALAHHRGAVVGGLLGVWGGMLIDVVPPALGPFAGWALVLGVVGAVHGHVVATRRPGPWLALGLLALSAAAAVLFHVLVLWFGGLPVGGAAALPVVLGTGAWALALAPVALVVTRVAVGRRRSDPMLLEAVTPWWAGRPAVVDGGASGPAPGMGPAIGAPPAGAVRAVLPPAGARTTGVAPGASGPAPGSGPAIGALMARDLPAGAVRAVLPPVGARTTGVAPEAVGPGEIPAGGALPPGPRTPDRGRPVGRGTDGPAPAAEGHRP